LSENVKEFANSIRALTSRKSYFLQVMRPANGRELSVVSSTAVERMSGPYCLGEDATGFRAEDMYWIKTFDDDHDN
jgi:hypothetical protein